MKQHFNTVSMSTVCDYIQNLPLELQERIRKELISMKITQRAALGWDKVHKELQETPFCNVFLFPHNTPYWWFWDDTQRLIGT